MTDHSRYRVEDGKPVVDLKLPGIENIFDNRDPAPFRDRDLDPDLVEYLTSAAEDLAAHDRFRIVFWLDKPCEVSAIEAAFRAHFDYELERIDRVRRRNRRTGQISLMLAVLLVIGLVSIAQLLGRLVQNTIGAGIKEGLMISCWVLMWRPVEVLVYDWIPWRRQRRVFKRLHEVPIDVRSGKVPA